MTLLPIVARELRVAARRRETYWTRLLLAVVAIFIGIMTLIFTIGLPSNLTGRFIFQCLAGLLFLYCLVYGRRATADSISYEKREGTLGLLFLTDLKGHDIVLGKLAATSAKGFYGLMAVFPVLAVPLLLGGITNGEFWRMVLVLVNTFLFSLAVGIFGSALSRDFRHAMGANLLFLIIFMGIAPALGLLLAYFSGKALIPEFFFSCPAYSFYLCSDARFGLQPHNFWWSIGVTHFLTWLLVLLSSWVVPRAWHDQPTRTRKNIWQGFWRRWNYGPSFRKSEFRQRLLNVNPFFWLASRVTRKTAHVWTFLFLMGVWWLVGWAMSGSVWFDPSVVILALLMLNCTFKIWITIEAGQQLAEDKRVGAFELLLTAPLKVEDILRGQLLALRHQFERPLMVVLVAELFLIGTVRGQPNEYPLTFWLAGMAMLVLDVVTLAWVGMATALTARSHNHATFSSVMRVLGLPWALLSLISGFCYVYYGVILGKDWNPTMNFYVGLWFGLGVVMDAIFGLKSWRVLNKKFHRLALQTRRTASSPGVDRKAETVGQKSSASADRLSASPKSPVLESQEEYVQTGGVEDFVLKRLVKWPLRHFPKPVLLVLIPVMLMVTVGLVMFNQRDVFPPETIVSIDQGMGRVKVFPTYGASIFVLPDGSLWRWGAAWPGPGPAQVPEQVGTDHDWVEAAACGNHYLGLRSNGTLWEWGFANNQYTNLPVQVDSGTNWIAISASGVHSIALSRDGTLWGWGKNSLSQLGNGVGLDVISPVQVGTNTGWRAIACHATGTHALAADGTIWTWGSIPITSQGATRLSPLPIPTQISSETNWIGFATGFTPLFRSRSGEIWSPFASVPNPNASVSSVCTFLISNCLPKGIAAAVTDVPRLFQLHADGTLWQQPYPTPTRSSGADQVWKQVGKRSNWISLWSANGTAFGLTSDNVIWTWGYDPSRPAKHSLSSWFTTMQTTLRNRLAKTPVTIIRPPRAYQKEPRPLIRLVSSKDVSTAQN